MKIKKKKEKLKKIWKQTRGMKMKPIKGILIKDIDFDYAFRDTNKLQCT